MDLPALTAAQRKRLAEIVSGGAQKGARAPSGTSASQKGRTCSDTTKSGTQCKNAAVEGSDRCGIHQPT